MYSGLIDFIRSEYADARKIVEVGIGPRPDVAQRVRKALPGVEVIVTDWDPAFVRFPEMDGIVGVADDIFEPTLDHYEGAALIYALRPPGEVLRALEHLADQVNADLWVSLLPDDVNELDEPGWARVTSGATTIGWFRRRNRDPPAHVPEKSFAARLGRLTRS